MSRIGNTGRTTSLMVSDRLLSTLRRTQQDMATSQNQISSGLVVGKPSDAPSKTSAILSLLKGIQAREQHDRNLQHALGVLNNADQALGDATNLLVEARSIASSQIGVGSNTDTRKNQATVIDASIKSMIDIANRRYQGVALFGGLYSPTADKSVFVEALGGIRYMGTRDNLTGDVGLDQPLQFNSNGVDAFGALSSRVVSLVDLDPQATAETRIADVNGTQNAGVRRGSVLVRVDGTEAMVDLTDAETLGDVVTRINAAIGNIDATAGSLAVVGSGFSLSAGAGHTIEIEEIGTSQTATDLGINASATGATVLGGDIDPRLTLATTLASFGASIDLTSGLSITQGNHTKVADFSGATTVQDMVGVINRLDLGLRLEINGEGNSLNLVSDISGIDLSIGENGGSTATDLGLRTFGPDTQLSTFNHGNGVQRAAGEPDFEIRLHGGESFQVNLDGVTDVAGVVSAIQTAAAAAGLSVGAPGQAGTDFNIGLAASGNGFALEDGTAGGDAFRVVQLGQSMAAENLGIYTNAETGNTIAGRDVSTVRVESAFSHLIALRNALLGDDSRGITVAGTAIETDVEALVKARADIGVRAQRVEQQQARSATLKIAEHGLLADLREVDMASAITRFTLLQQQLEASLRVGAQNLQLSLFDFLR